MRTWIAKLLWKIRGPKNVRVQYKNNQGAVDGILLGVWAKHYRLVNAYFYEHSTNAQGVELLGTTWIPEKEVLLVQEKNAS